MASGARPIGWADAVTATERGQHFAKGARGDFEGVRELLDGSHAYVMWWGHPGAFHDARAFLPRGEVVTGVPAVVDLLEVGLVVSAEVRELARGIAQVLVDGGLRTRAEDFKLGDHPWAAGRLSERLAREPTPDESRALWLKVRSELARLRGW